MLSSFLRNSTGDGWIHFAFLRSLVWLFRKSHVAIHFGPPSHWDSYFCKVDWGKLRGGHSFKSWLHHLLDCRPSTSSDPTEARDPHLKMEATRKVTSEWVNNGVQDGEANISPFSRMPRIMHIHIKLHFCLDFFSEVTIGEIQGPEIIMW